MFSRTYDHTVRIKKIRLTVMSGFVTEKIRIPDVICHFSKIHNVFLSEHKVCNKVYLFIKIFH